MGLLLLSVVDCGFGAVSLSTDGSVSRVAYGFNLTLAVLLAVLTAQDLRRRGWRWQAPAVGVSYLAAPLVGLALYAITSGRPAVADQVSATAAAHD